LKKGDWVKIIGNPGTLRDQRIIFANWIISFFKSTSTKKLLLLKPGFPYHDEEITNLVSLFKIIPNPYQS
jgi:hypothetical protein